MKIRYNLKSPAGPSSLIVLKLRYISTESLPFVFSIKETVLVKHWDTETMRCKTIKSFPQAKWINAKLDKYETTALDFIRQRQVMNGKPPSYKELKSHLTYFKHNMEGHALVNETNVEKYILKIAGRFTTKTRFQFKGILYSLFF